MTPEESILFQSSGTLLKYCEHIRAGMNEYELSRADSIEIVIKDKDGKSFISARLYVDSVL